MTVPSPFVTNSIPVGALSGQVALLCLIFAGSAGAVIWLNDCRDAVILRLICVHISR